MAQRRGRGDGTLYQEAARNRWVGAVTLDGRRRKVTAPTKPAARAALNALIRDHANGQSRGDGNATVSEAVSLWRTRVLANRKYEPKTRELYEWSCDLLVAELGAKRLRSLDVATVEAALDHLATRTNARPLGKRSLKHVRGTLGQVLDMAVKRKMTGSNAARVAELTPTAKAPTDRKALDSDQARRLWVALGADARRGALFRLQLVTGLRPGEAAGLCTDVVDLDRSPASVTVRRAVRTEKGRAVLVDILKTNASYRTIGVPSAAVEVLRAQRVRVAEAKLKEGTEWTDCGLLFPGARGGPLDPAANRRALAKVCRSAGLPELTPNELRHTAATVLVDQGVPIEVVADLLGHVNTNTLTTVYRHRVRPVIDVGGALDAIAIG